MPASTAPHNTQSARLYVVCSSSGILVNIAKMLQSFWKEAEELSLSICKAQEAFAVNKDQAVFETTIASGKEFIKLLATEKKLCKKQHDNKQGSLETRLDCFYSVMRFTAQIAVAKV